MTSKMQKRSKENLDGILYHLNDSRLVTVLSKIISVVN